MEPSGDLGQRATSLDGKNVGVEALKNGKVLLSTMEGDVGTHVGNPRQVIHLLGGLLSML